MSLPLEQKAREESESYKISWNKGPYNFLLSRTSEKYKLKYNSLRRSYCEEQLSVTLPKITDEMLLSLYKFACLKYQHKCRSQFGLSSGFYSTPSETQFANTLRTIIERNPVLRHLEVYPSHQHSKDLLPNFKGVIGNYVPDFIIFGLKIEGASAVVIEIDGDSHVEKFSKDQMKNKHYKELSIFTWEVPNHMVYDFPFLEKAILEMYRLRNGSLNEQILRTKRMIWTKTIVCQLTLQEIEAYIAQQYSTKLFLLKELSIIKDMKSCPRAIKREAKKIRY